MNVNKEAGVDCGLEVSPEELKAINAMSKKKLRPEEVYAFAVRLCDNEIDRDNERFPAATLEELAPLFVGRSGLFDHQWSTRNQAARIYRTEVVRESWMTEAGEPYCYLKGCAYLLRTEGNRELIAAIEGGIKKEVSVGCAVERSVCSICGEEFHTCPHEKGAEYGGRRCWAELVGASDAYEWSFVAVPAQRNAGVMKHMRMEQEAALGRKYLESLRGEVARLGGLAGLGLEHAVLRGIADKLGYDELLALKGALERQAERVFPVETQLRAGERRRAGRGIFDLSGPRRREDRGERRGSMSRISFEGIGEVAATFACGEGVKAGQVVKLTGDGTVGPCGDGERFCGVALSAGEGFAAVQMGGLIRVAASGGALSEGWNRLLADGSGGVRPDSAETPTGGEYLVVRAESGGAVIRL